MHDHLGYDELDNYNYHTLESLQQGGKRGINADKQNELGPPQQAENASTQKPVESGKPSKCMTIWATMN